MKNSVELTIDLQRFGELKKLLAEQKAKFLRSKASRKPYQNREVFMKKIFALLGTNFKKQHEKRIIKLLQSERFQRQFYAMQKIVSPPTWKDKVKLLFTNVISFFDRFKKKSHVEYLIERMELIDEMSLVDKRIKMANLGLDPMIERDDDRDPIDIKNEEEELKSYREELSEFLKDDPQYLILKKQQDDAIRANPFMGNTDEWFRAIKQQDEPNPDTHWIFTSTNPNDLNRQTEE